MNHHPILTHTLLVFILIGLLICLNINVVSAASLEINGSSQTLYGNISYDYVNITNGSILYITAYNGTSGTGTLNLTVLYDVNIDATSSINGVGRGYLGGGISNYANYCGKGGTGPGAGATASSCATSGGGGGGGAGYGSNGGAGGNGYIPGGAGGSTYGTIDGLNIQMGSGAGGAGTNVDNQNGAAGSPGGAAVNIKAANNITISGTINMNGSVGGNSIGSAGAASGGGGGASGGGILINGKTVNINSAKLYLSGGVGGTGVVGGGTGSIGGGGRLKVFHMNVLSNTSTVVVSGTAYYEKTNSTPTIPLITNPLNNSVDYSTTTINMTWAASTDVESDAINYYYQIANDSAFTDILHSGNTSNTYTGSKAILANIQYFFRVRANDLYGTSGWSPINSIRDLSLSTPANNSIHYFNYPPMVTTFSFVWSATESSVVNYNLLISKDVNFNLISSDTTFSGTTQAVSLDEGTYWYKVRPYYTATGTFGSFTNAWNFTLISNMSVPDGTGIHGIIYELVNGIQTPVSNARVIIRNDVLNWTSEQITGSNGYYLFTGLVNETTYNLYATKSDTFKDSVAYYVTTGLGTTFTQNILLERCYSGFDCFYNQAYVKFTIQSIFGTTYSNVAVSVYEGDDLVAEKIGTTGSDGSVTFLLKKDQEYRITFIKASNDIDMEITLTPGESKDFTIVIWSFGDNRDDSVSWNLSATDNDATTTNLNLAYADTSGLTTLINFWVLNGSDQSDIIYSSSSAASSFSDGYAVNDTIAASFIYGFNATRDGTIITENKAITFTGSGTLIDLKIDNKYYNWISIIFLVAISLLFSKNSNRNGYILIPLVALLLSLVGWFSISYLITSSALVIGTIAYLRSAEKKSEGGMGY